MQIRALLFACCLAAAWPCAGAQMDITTFNGLRRGMPESEVLLRAGPPDLVTEPGGAILAYGDYGGSVLVGSSRVELHYMPDSSDHDPQLTIVTLSNGRVSDLERRKIIGEIKLPPPPPPEEEELAPESALRSDDDIRRDRAERTLDAAERYADVRARIKQRMRGGNAASDAGRPLYRGTDDQGRPYFGDVPPPPVFLPDER